MVDDPGCEETAERIHALSQVPERRPTAMNEQIRIALAGTGAAQEVIVTAQKSAPKDTPVRGSLDAALRHTLAGSSQLTAAAAIARIEPEETTSGVNATIAKLLSEQTGAKLIGRVNIALASARLGLDAAEKALQRAPDDADELLDAVGYGIDEMTLAVGELKEAAVAGGACHGCIETLDAFGNHAFSLPEPGEDHCPGCIEWLNADRPAGFASEPL